MPYELDKRRPRRQSLIRADGSVLVDGPNGLERALREFRREVAYVMSEARNRMYFVPKPTRSARKRRGKVLEKRRLKFEEMSE
ncbi:hypothetical protein LCGC14_1144200 [marine sediment metagenome]|uniref:30S ribosomal protein S21 n=1 Tax=marine sediment metagenome TaxID=412755 RepID=A0A0F9M289_9ZZZZ